MCGASGAQQQISTEQNAFYSQLTQQYATEFGQAEGIFNTLVKNFRPILKAGPGQEGFTPQEKAALNTQASSGVAANYQHAKQAVGAATAAEGGGNDYIPSGATNAVNASIADAAAGQQSNEQNQITEADYATGRQNWIHAGDVLGGATSVFNPSTGMANAATDSGKAAAETANQIASQNSSWMGLVGGVLGDAASVASAGFSKGGAFNTNG